MSDFTYTISTTVEVDPKIEPGQWFLVQQDRPEGTTIKVMVGDEATAEKARGLLGETIEFPGTGVTARFGPGTYVPVPLDDNESKLSKLFPGKQTGLFLAGHGCSHVPRLGMSDEIDRTCPDCQDFIDEVTGYSVCERCAQRLETYTDENSTTKRFAFDARDLYNIRAICEGCIQEEPQR